MGTATTTTTPESAVEALMKQVADENGLEITENLASVPSQTIGKFMFFWYFRKSFANLATIRHFMMPSKFQATVFTSNFHSKIDQKSCFNIPTFFITEVIVVLQILIWIWSE